MNASSVGIIIQAVTPLVLGVIAYIVAANKRSDQLRAIGQDAVQAAIALTRQFGGDVWARYLEELDAIAQAEGFLPSSDEKMQLAVRAQSAFRAAGLPPGKVVTADPKAVAAATTAQAVAKVQTEDTTR